MASSGLLPTIVSAENAESAQRTPIALSATQPGVAISEVAPSKKKIAGRRKRAQRELLVEIGAPKMSVVPLMHDG
jgi:hypothetical protein